MSKKKTHKLLVERSVVDVYLVQDTLATDVIRKFFEAPETLTHIETYPIRPATPADCLVVPVEPEQVELEPAG